MAGKATGPKPTSAHWSQAYTEGKQVEVRNEPSSFAKAVAKRLDADDKVLELGCGIGVDAAHLAGRARSVIAVDFAEEPIGLSRERFKKPNLEFKVHNISLGLGQFADSSFDAVYARRSLHYFDEETTEKIFREIGRVLVSGGQLFFEVKSANDPNAGQQAEEGDVRHFFTTNEIESLLPEFEIESEEHPDNDFFGHESVFLICRAKKV